MNKRGSLQDILLFGVVLVVFAVIILVGYTIAGSLDTQIQGFTGMPTAALDASTTMKGHYTGVMDNSFLFLAVGFGIGVLALAALVRVHPIFAVFFFLGLALLIFFAGIFSNIYQGIAENPNFTAEAADLTFTSNIMEFLPLFVGVFGTILMAVMYKLRTFAE